MKKKEGILIIFFLIILVIILSIIIYYSNKKNKPDNIIGNEYIPQEEISENQLRNTIVSLYFVNKENGEITPEARTININLLLNNPYEFLVNQLMEGPKNEKLEKSIPEGTKINNINLKEGTLYIDFSKEFIENAKKGKENENKIIETIIKTLTELNEVNSVKINIDGAEKSGFIDNEISFEEPFFIKDFN